MWMYEIECECMWPLEYIGMLTLVVHPLCSFLPLKQGRDSYSTYTGSQALEVLNLHQIHLLLLIYFYFLKNMFLVVVVVVVVVVSNPWNMLTPRCFSFLDPAKK